MQVVNSGDGNFGDECEFCDKLNSAASTLRFSILKLSRVFNLRLLRLFWFAE